MTDRLTILLTNIWLDRYGGSEVVTRDMALGLLRRGHRPIVYTPKLGDVSSELAARGVAVIDDLRQLAERPDIIHAHHSIPCAEALIRFPDVPAINVCHAFESWIEAPAHFPQVAAYVAVDEACRDRLVHTEGIDPARVLMLYNAVDLTRIPARPRPLPSKPMRALVFGKASDEIRIRTACQALGIHCETLGYQVERVSSQPERELVEVDLVFATARSAIEALCSGCAVIVCDSRGMAGLVTSTNFDRLRACNFGLRSLSAPVTVAGLIKEIHRYDIEDATEVAARARHEADLEGLLDAFESLYAEVLGGTRQPDLTLRSHARAVARFLHKHLPRHPADSRWPWLMEREALSRRIEELEHQLAKAPPARRLRSRLIDVRRWLGRMAGRPDRF